MPVLKMRTGGGPNAEGFERKLEESEHMQPETLSQLDEWIETALECEKHLGRKQYRVRKLILNLKAKRDHLLELGEVLADRRAA